MKFIPLYHREITGNKADEETFLDTRYLKNITYQQHLKLISDRAHLRNNLNRNNHRNKLEMIMNVSEKNLVANKHLVLSLNILLTFF